ncbi:MAG TPA: hypothetical protein VID48_04285 [Solirubrobacteraceae bacterium]
MPAKLHLIVMLAAAYLAASPPHASATLSTQTTAGSPGVSTTTALGPLATPSTLSGESPVPVVASDVPPAGRRLSSNEVLVIASRLPKMRSVRREYPGSYGGAYLKGPLHWQVSYFSRGGKKEIGQAIINDATGRVLEQWTGFQVAWTMARGYPGAFGRHINSLYIWLPLCLLFLAPFFRWRKPFSLLHLDLLVLISFSISLAFFNHGNIYASVPLTYPPLVYLLVRMLLLAGVAGSRERGGRILGVTHEDPVAEQQAVGRQTLHTRLVPYRPRRREASVSWMPVSLMAVAVVFLLGFRIALNVTDSNVIDVGYAGVIGAQKIVHNHALYGRWPSNNEHGDTYGPANYESYIPFEQIFGFSGRWDDLPAAHAAAITFDLLAVALLFLIGVSLCGPALGVALAYAWVSFPFTLFALESNSNDMLVAVLVLAAVLAASRPRVRGAFAALAGLSKFAPLALAPLFGTHSLRETDRSHRLQSFASFLLSFLVVSALVAVPALRHNSLQQIYERTIAYQANRDSPFSVWGLYGGLGVVQGALQLAAVGLALALAVLPRRADVIGLAASCAAILIAAQLGIDHWFYLYIPWFFGLVMIALLASVVGVQAEPAPRAPLQPTVDLSLSRPKAFAL